MRNGVDGLLRGPLMAAIIIHGVADKRSGQFRRWMGAREKPETDANPIHPSRNNTRAGTDYLGSGFREGAAWRSSTCASGSAGGFTFCLAPSRWTATQPRKQCSWFTCGRSCTEGPPVAHRNRIAFLSRASTSPSACHRPIVPSPHRSIAPLSIAASQHRSPDWDHPSPATRAVRACRAHRDARDPSLESLLWAEPHAPSNGNQCRPSPGLRQRC